MNRLRLPLLVAVAALAVACGGNDAETTNTSLESEVVVETIGTPEYLTLRDQPVACSSGAPLPARAMSFPAPEDLGLSGKITAVITTSCGEITIELDADAAPATVNSFVYLAQEGYFDGTASHRIVEGFMIQAGDPTATGRGGPGYLLPDELPPADFLYARGTVAMANGGPNTSGSQFFMMLEDTALPPAYSVFGVVIDGLDVLDRIARIPTTARQAGREPSSPTETVYIEKVEINP